MIYRGCEKRMIKIKDPESRFFEEAYFVLKEELYNEQPPLKDMVQEANRIILSGMSRKRKKRPGIKGILFFLFAAVILSLALSVALYFIR